MSAPRRLIFELKLSWRRSFCLCRPPGGKILETTMSVKPEYVFPVVAGTCVAAVGVAIGYCLAKQPPVTKSNKSYETTNPLLKYACEHTVKLTPAQKKLAEATFKHSEGFMMGSPDELHLLASICRAIGAKKTIDIGVFTGVSALSISQVLPEDGKLVACDVSAEYPEIGKPFWKEAGVDKKIDLRIAPAEVTLQQLLYNGEAGTYDFAFIDAMKSEYDIYYELCLKLMRPGGLIAFDNMVQRGKVIDPNITSQAVVAIRKLNDKLHNDDRVESTLLLIGDGTVLAFKR